MIFQSINREKLENLIMNSDQVEFYNEVYYSNGKLREEDILPYKIKIGKEIFYISKIEEFQELKELYNKRTQKGNPDQFPMAGVTTPNLSCPSCKKKMFTMSLLSDPPHYEAQCSSCGYKLPWFHRADSYTPIIQEELDSYYQLKYHNLKG